ncbi:MAG: type II toxin-antitoxin system VapC family toxin [Acidobacteria bacterium]|nr:type II toxin-antitoxin system VapC family toxin [Acidobacteriota bacterium]
MILLDANLLVYARVAGSRQHDAARAWLDEQLDGTAAVGLPWPSLLAFVRLTTNPRIFERPQTVTAAWKQVEEWLNCPAVWIPSPTERHREFLAALLTGSAVRANLVPDAHLAALAVEHGLVLCSTDGDFARFPGLRWRNPLGPTETIR